MIPWNNGSSPGGRRVNSVVLRPKSVTASRTSTSEARKGDAIIGQTTQFLWFGGEVIRVRKRDYNRTGGRVETQKGLIS